MTIDQLIGFAVLAICGLGVGAWLLICLIPAPRAKRYSSVARAPEPQDSVIDSYYNDGKIDELLAQGRTGADFVKMQQPQPEPAPEWIRGMHGPKGRILSKAQFDSLTADERAYYHRKYLNNHGWPKVGE